jgi:hypothetical protein
MNRYMRYYRSVWFNLLKHLLGWPPSHILQWWRSAKRTWPLEDPNAYVYHERPSYWIVETIVDHFLPMISDAEYTRLESRILALLNEGNPDFTGPIDWLHYRNEIKKIVGISKATTSVVSTGSPMQISGTRSGTVRIITEKPNGTDLVLAYIVAIEPSEVVNSDMKDYTYA